VLVKSSRARRSLGE